MLRAASWSHEHDHPASEQTRGDHSRDCGPDHSHEDRHHDQRTKFRTSEPLHQHHAHNGVRHGHPHQHPDAAHRHERRANTSHIEDS
jgi:hypothetical protein